MCDIFKKSGESESFVVPWYQVCATLDSKNRLMNRIVMHDRVNSGDSILVQQSLVKEMSWLGKICDTKDDLDVSYEDDEFLDNKNDLEFAIAHDTKERAWISSLKRAGMYLGGETTRQVNIKMKLFEGKTMSEDDRNQKYVDGR